MKINHITIQNKPNHPGVLISWKENGQLMTKTACDTVTALKYVIHKLVDINLNLKVVNNRR